MGRPKGSKNKVKRGPGRPAVAAVAAKRGRPAGSGKRGRPAGSGKRSSANESLLMEMVVNLHNKTLELLNAVITQGSFKVSKPCATAQQFNGIAEEQSKRRPRPKLPKTEAVVASATANKGSDKQTDIEEFTEAADSQLDDMLNGQADESVEPSIDELLE